MKISNTIKLLVAMVCISWTMSFNYARGQNSTKLGNEEDLYATMVALDSTFFTAYNTCDLVTQGRLISENLEFYHDQSGLQTSKEEVLKAVAKNICGKVRRTLVQGSLEVSPIPGYGAVVTGLHNFTNNSQDQYTTPKNCRFLTVWQNKGAQWQMTRIISLH